MSDKPLDRFLNEQGQVINWPKKHADKEMVIAYLATKFDKNKHYHELEVNELLKTWHTFSDWPLLRRGLFERGYLDRNISGTDYHLKNSPAKVLDK